MHCRRSGVYVAYLLIVAIAWCERPLWAQPAPATADARVERLYAAAKAAEARGDIPAAIAGYEAMLAAAPRLAAAYNNLGALYVQVGDYAKAVGILEKGLKIDPAMPSAAALLGFALYEMGDYAAARPRLEAALKANPKDDRGERMLAEDLVKLGELEAAAAHLQQLSRRQPRDEESWYLLGKIYMRLAEQALGRLNEIDPDSALAHQVAGEIMESLKNYEGALLEYKKAVAKAPGRPGTHYALGNLYWTNGQWEAAAQEFQAELANDRGNCLAQWKLGNIVLEQGLKPEEAIAPVERALALCPSLAQARVDHARACLKLNRNAEAAQDLEAAAKTNPDEPTVHFFLAQAYRALGRTQDAAAEMQIFARLEEKDRAQAAKRARDVMDEQAPH
jgi:tetratricopeptide (TPR) repeat protein